MSPGFGEPTQEEERETVETINASGARILWVGLGSPKQDLWMARLRPRLECDLLLGVGAAFDFVSGRKAQAPRWMQKGGLEWTFRLAHEPRRLWRRYAIQNPRFIWKIGLQYARHRAAFSSGRIRGAASK
jgi:N-acetylglucosaminyldiphosphoundecaprenol N-acetyl-beta-D-mannosaminyltransferase